MRFLERYVALAAQAPDAPALIDDFGAISRARLLAAAAAVARDLATTTPATGAAPPVGVAMPKSAGAVAVMLGALLAGRAYVPLDPGLPVERRARMIADSGLDVVYVADVAAAGEVGAPEGRPVAARVFDPRDAARLPFADARPGDAASASADAAILYTSGSTNQPKGVRLSRGAVDVFLDWALDYFGLGEGDVTASHAPFGFDISLLDLFGALGAGAAVALVPEGQMANGRFLAEFAARHGVTFWQSTPTALTALTGAIRDGAEAPALAHVCSTGEALPPATRRALSELCGAPGATAPLFHNIYGCTETNDSFVLSAPVAEIAALPAETDLPVGRPLPFIAWRVVDENLSPVAEGGQGELLVASRAAFTGYTDAALTKAAHVEVEGARYYRTRDIVRVEEDGNLRFFGRVDHTVKLRGVRVDLREIEACLAGVAGLHDPVAFVRDCPRKGRVLVCGFQFTGAPPSLVALKGHCARQLPRQVVPDLFLPVSEALPRNVNGKVDRRAAIAAFADALDEQQRTRLETQEKTHAHQQ